MDDPLVAHGSATTLLYTLLEIIERAVRACILEVPDRSTKPVTSSLLAGRFTAQNADHQDPVWP